jgi:glycine cleavage system H lipoate-binding protein
MGMTEFADELKLFSSKSDFESKIWINDITGDVYVSITNFEFELFKENFFVDPTPSGRRLSAQTVYAISLEVSPVIPGSNEIGPGQTDIKH